MKNVRIAVIGGGVSGIAACYYMLKRGYDVHLYESGSAIGGRIAVDYLGNQMIAMGGKNVPAGAALFREFVKDHGDYAFENFGLLWQREINGKLLPVKAETLFENIKNIFRVGNIIDILKFSFLVSIVKLGKGKHDFLDSGAFKIISRLFDKRPISSYFSKRFNDYFIRPMTLRMNGAEPDNYYLGNLSSNLGMARLASKGMEQLEGDGLEMLLNNFASSNGLTVLKNSRVSSVTHNANQDCYEVSYLSGGGDSGAEAVLARYDGVIVALTANAASPVLANLDKEIAKQLSSVVYNPIGLAVVRYKKPIFNQKCKSIIMDSSRPVSHVGVYGLSDMDLVRYSFSGHAAKQLLENNLADEDIVTIGEEILSQYYEVSSDDRLEYVYRCYTEGLCSYTPYHHKLLDFIDARLDKFNVELTGDYLFGNSINTCFRASQNAAIRLHNKLSAKFQNA